jgi:hypothetical protein
MGRKQTKPKIKEVVTQNHQLTHLLKSTYLYLLIRLKFQFRQVAIVTHTDFDGMISAALLLQRYPYALLYVATPNILHKVLYIVKNQTITDFPLDLFILDLGFSPGVQGRLLRAIQDLRKTIQLEVYWVDHHEYTEILQLRRYVQVRTDPECPQTAYLVQRLLNTEAPMDESLFRRGNVLLSILEYSRTPFAQYWTAILKEVARTGQRELTVAVVRALAQFRRSPLIYQLYQRTRQCKATPVNASPPPEILETDQGHRFLLVAHQPDTELYPQVHALLTRHQLDFVVVSFADGTLSLYKNRQSAVDLHPLYDLVDGKGHDYAFHFTPQIRISDEFYQPVNLPDLMAKVQEVL